MPLQSILLCASLCGLLTQQSLILTSRNIKVDLGRPGAQSPLNYV